MSARRGRPLPRTPDPYGGVGVTAPARVDREVLAVLVALQPLANDVRLTPVFARLAARREFAVQEVLDIGTWSSGERVLIEWAGALWAGHGQVDIGYIASSMSDRFRNACIGALAAYGGQPLPSFDSMGQAVPA
jgi:hypothetical protein